jgi:predicted ABC-class ATPase
MGEIEIFNILGVKYFDKDFEKCSYTELVEAPVFAISGVSEADATDLKKALKVKSVGDLATNKYVQISQALTAFSDISTEVLDKKFESKEFKKLRKQPVSAISGISERSGKLLKKTLGIDTIEKLAGNKYVKIAQITVTMAALESMF